MIIIAINTNIIGKIDITRSVKVYSSAERCIDDIPKQEKLAKTNQFSTVDVVCVKEYIK